MSIATDEAERKYPAFSGDMKRRSLNMPFHIGYVNGRTAELTKSEIEAAAFTLWQFDNIMKMPDLSEIEMESIWNKLSHIRRAAYTARAAQVLDASRQAVSE